MANGTLKVSNIQTSSGSGTITLGQSGETVTIASGVTQTVAVNTPAFEAMITSEQNPSGGTDTLINFDNEIFDTAGAYDTTNKRFTVPSGEAGKYHFYCNACIGGSANSSLQQSYIYVYKNGSKTTTRAHFNTNNDGNGRYYELAISTTMALVAGDYIEIYGRADLASGTVEVRVNESRFGGYKLIGA
mgnify:CR=1 FL=1